MKRHIRGLLAHLLSAPQRWRRPLATVTFFVIVASGFALARTSASAQFASFTWPESLSRIFGYSSPRTMTPIMPAGTTYTWIQGAQIIKGTLFDSTGLPLSGRTIKLLQNGTSAGTTTTDGSGVYSFTGVTLASGDKIAVYISGALEKGATVTLSGTADITDLDIRRNVLIVRSDNGGSITNFNLREAGGGSPDEDLKAVGSLDPTNVLSVPVSVTLEIWTGSTYAPLADINDAGNWTNNGTFAPGANTVTFNGVSNQTIAGSSSTTFNNLTISNTGTSPDDVVSLDGSAGATNTVVSQLIITGGVFDQGTDLASSNLTTIGGGRCIEVRPGKTWRNRGRGDETLSCDVLNEGTIEFNGDGKPCGEDDEIEVRSSVPGLQRTWEGPGVFSMIDVDVRDQRVPGGSNLPLQILVNSGTNSLNNTGWTFSVTCAGPYTWIGGTGQRWADEVNWSPIRPGANNASTSDVLIFDGSVTPATVVEDVQSQTNSAIRLQNGAVVILHANIGGATLTLEGATGQDFEVPTGTLLTVAGGQPLIIELTAPTGIGGSVPAGHVAGQILMKDDRHQLIGANAGEIIITGALTIDPTYSAITHPFGSGKSGSVVFESGSTGMFSRGLDPFGGAGRAVVTFNAGSTAHFLSNGAFFGDTGATYGNLILDGTQGYTFAGSSETTILNNLQIEPGSTFLLSSSPGADLNLYGNFVDKTVVSNGFSPNQRVVKFLGTTQTVSKGEGGIAGFDGVFINQSPGGKVQLLSPTDIGQLNLSTADSLLELNGQVLELVGTVTGPGNLKGDPNAIIAASGGGAVGTVNFVSGGRNLAGLLLNREPNGSMTLGTDLAVGGTLRLDNGKLFTANTLSLSSTSTVLRTNGYVIGNLQKAFGASGNLGTFTFPLGTANAYSPLDANVTANTNGTLTVKAVQGQQPNIPGANRLRRYWTLSGSGITADLTFHYSTSPTNDVVGNEAIYKIFKYDGSFTQFTPDATGVNSASDHFATLNNVSSFSDWTLAEPVVVNPGTVAFVGAPYTTTEGSADHDVTITVARSVGTDGALDVTYATSNGTATAGSDYISATGTLHWDNGETGSKTFPITVRGDTTYEADETVTITLSDVTGGATIGGPNPTTLTITNDDNPPATLVVNTTNDVIAGVCDATHCSLREAINAANFSSDTSTINFNIPNTDPGFAGGVYTIVVIVTALPTITQPVTIDGASQTTFNGDTNVDGPEIVLTGAVLGGPNNGLVTANTAANSIIKDLVVNGFGGTGITVDGNNIQVLNSYIGTNASGTVAVANAVGLAVGTSSAPTSGYTITGNLISGNTGVGISGCNVQGATFSNNKIGTDRTGVNNVGNVSHGFLAACTSFRDTTISNNTIAFNGGDGFRDAPEYVGSTSANDHPNNRLTQNSIFENGGLGINLKEPPNGSLDLVTPNDPGDGDEGGNHLQNFPVVTVATAGSTVVTGTLNTTPSTSGYVIEIFSNPACNTFGHGEGKTFLGAVTTGATDTSGNVNFTVTVPALLADQVLAATATDANGNTSEFSACFPVTVAPTLSIGDATVTEGSSGGTTNANFILLLSAPMAQDVIVGYSTQDDTATGGTDYVAITNGSTTIPAGQIAGIITVTVNQDTVNEPDETFFVNISSSSPVTISDGQGLGTITDDDLVPTISIDDVTHNEGNAGTTNYTFTVTLSNPSQGTITVAYQTQDNSAAAPGDYTAVSTPQTLSFVPGDTSEQFTIQVNGDTLNEANETFFVNLSSNSANSTILDGQGLGTINNDDAVPAITFPSSATQVEGNSGQTDLVIQVNLATASGQTASVDWTTGADPGATHPATAGGACGAGVDYLTSSGTVTFAPGVTTGSIHIPVCGDPDPEFDETFRVTISNPVNASIPAGGDVSLATITNDDTPTLSIVATASQTEANTGQANMPFAVTLSSASEQTVTVHYMTANGSTNPATGGIACGGTTDYVTTSNTLTFNPGETAKTIDVPICGDITDEPDETLTVTLDTPTNATISQATGTGTINDDDAQPTISINDVAQSEGDAGTTNFTFTVSLSNPSQGTITVDYATAPGTSNPATGGATCGGSTDYQSRSGSVTFSPGQTSNNTEIVVSVCGDTLVELDETFLVNLSNNSSNSILPAGTKGTGTITNDDHALSINTTSTVTEGDSGQQNMTFTVTLSPAHSQIVTVHYATANGSTNPATGGGACGGSVDYVTTSGTLTFNPTQTEQTINVPICGDTRDEPDETLTVTLDTPTNATISQATGTGTITDNDPIPTISINDVTQSEGDAGTTNFNFTVSLSNPSEGAITVDYATANGTATAPSDYAVVTTPVTLTFNPDETTKQVTIQVNGDTLNEANETFFVNLSSNSANSTILDGQGLGTINNDDAVPAITFPNSATQVEGNSGQTELIIQVNLATASGQTASVDWATGADPGATHPATAGGTCGAGIDYLTSSGTVTFAPGVTTGSIHIPVCGDTDPEFDETFRVTISNPVNASIPAGGDVSLTTITNDDTPTLSIVATASQTEANTGQANMPFAVTLSVASEQTVTVHYATANGSTNPATGGIACGGTTDYVTTSGTLTFNPTETVQTINVPVCGDTREEPDETLTVTLDTPTNATISQATGTGTITNDDHAPVANAVNTFTPANTLKTITLSATDADGDALTFSIVDSPQHGTLSNFGTPSCSAGNCTETVDYTPTVGYTGPDTFTYKANDGANDSNTATVSINVFACPTTFTVNSLGDESDATLGDGLCDVDGNASGDQCTLRAAIEEANALSACGPITIDATGLSGQLDLGSALPAINHNVNINGPGAATLTVQRSTAPATPEFRIFAIGTLGNVTVAISGLTISNGRISDASLSQGGGIFIGNGSLTLTGVAVAGNSVGGPVSAQGGGIYNALGALTITNSTISGNSATAAGENDGGGIYNSSTLTVINSTVSGNSVSGGSTGIGGGIYSNGTSSLTNCTVSNNSASGSGLNQGGGINNVSGSMSSRSTIISGNTCSTGPDFNGALTSLGHNLIGNTSGATVTPQPGDRFDANASPLNLGPLANNGGPTQTMALGSGSVAIDGGDDCVADSAHCGDPNLPQLTTDQRGTGFPRQVDGNNDETAQVDIGAYEAPPCTPPATPTASNGGPYCEGATIQLSTPTVAGATYAWTGPNGFTSSVQNPTRPNATTADAGTYSVTITVNGCASAAGTTNVVVNPTPATPIASNGGPYCEGATIQLSTPTVAGATYSWTGPNGFTSSLQNPTRPNATTADAGTYSLTIVVDACASAAGSTNVVVNATPPTPTASNGGPYCEGATIQLSTPTVSGASYSWTGPNGFTSSLQNPTRPNATTADAGTYSVTITVNGCASAAGSTNVVVNPTPATPTVSNGGPYCEGATIQLSTPAVAGATYAWTGPNGFTSSLQNPTRPNATTADAGTYSVTITVNGCASAAGSTNVVVNPTPATPTVSNGGPYCEGATIQLSTPTVAGATYAWTGPNGFTSSLQNPTRPNATTADAGTYSVTITVNGCSSAAGSTNVVVNATPATPTASNGGPYCEGATIQLSTPTVAGATYAWTGPNGFTSSLQNPTRPNATTADAGTYSVTITVNGCASAAGSTNVVVNPTPATPTASNGGPYCEGATISLSTPTVAGATYSWTGPNGFTSSVQNPTRPNATTADAGTYSVTITVNGCASAAGSTNVVVNATPATPTASNGGPYLEGATIQLSTPTVAGATYSWTGPNSFTSSLQNPTRSNATPSDAGIYSVTITVNGCPSAAGTTNVVVNPNAAPTITDPGTLNLDPNSSAQFDIFANDADLGQNLSFSVAVGDVSCPDPPAGKFSSISFSGTTQLSTNPNNWKSVLTINALAGSQGSYTQKIQVTDGVTPTTRCLSITVAEPDTGVTLIGGNLVITDVNGGNSSDAVTLSLNGSNVRINDPIHVLGCGAGVSIDTHTCEFPLTSITGNIQVDGVGGNDTLTLALGGGNFIPQTGGVIYNGGDPTSAPGDQLIITGGNQGTVTYQYTNANDGSIAMSNFGTVTYTGLEPISNTGTATDIIFELPPGPNAATLADDGTGGNTMSRLSGATFETTDFANPTGSLTIRRGNAADTIVVNALPDFDANLTIGFAGNEFSTVTFSGAITLASNNALAANASGTIDLSNGSNALTTSGTGTMNFTAANVTGAGNVSTGGGLTVGNTGSSSTLSGAIAGTGGLTKLGAGPLVLSGANTYTGATAVNAGRLNIDGSIDSNTTVNSGATLGGTGTINSANTLTINSGGVVAPGTSPGILNTGSVTFNISSSLAVEIGGTTPGNAATNHDQLNVTGTVSLVNAVLGLSSFNGFTPSAGQSFVIISNDGTDAVSGTFNGLPEGATIPSFLGSALKATITYAGGTGNDVVLTAAAPVPGNLQFSAANYDDTEQNSGTHTATITVQRVGGIDGAVSVHWATSAGTATPGSDYTESTGDLNWADGDAGDKTLTVTVSGDTNFEANETVNLTLSAPTGGAGLGTPNLATLTITNDEIATNISIQDAQVVEPSSGSVNMIFTVTLSAPAPAGGVTVNFTTQDEPPASNHATAGQDYTTTSGTVNFASGEQFKTIAVTVLTDSNVESNETYLVLLSSPVNGTIADGTATGTILIADQPGTVLISELRTSGPGGAGDDFVEIYNNTDSPLTIAASDASAGYGLYKMGADCNTTLVLIGVIPNGTIIPARGHYLFVGSAYSLADYGGTGAAAGDQTLLSDVESDHNVALFTTAEVASISSTNRLDAVGFGANTGGVCDLLREGTTLSPMVGSVLEYSFFRDECGKKGNPALFGPCPSGGFVKDANVNNDDLVFADTTAAMTMAGQRLGAPGPQNLASPTLRNSSIAAPLIDSTVVATAPPNRVRDLAAIQPNAANGTLSIRRRFVNNTGAPVTRLRFRIMDISAFLPPGSVADMRALTSGGVIVNGVADSATCLAANGVATTPCTITVQGTTVETPPAQALGGGLNSSMLAGTITLATPLAAGASINLHFLLGVQQPGSFKFFVNIEALGGGAPAAPTTTTIIRTSVTKPTSP